MLAFSHIMPALYHISSLRAARSGIKSGQFVFSAAALFPTLWTLGSNLFADSSAKAAMATAEVSTKPEVSGDEWCGWKNCLV